MASKSYIMAIFRIIAKCHDRRITVIDLADALLRGGGGGLFLSPFEPDDDIPVVVKKILSVLQELHDLGIVQMEEGSVFLPPPSPPELPPPPGTGDGDNGSGLGQVLAHQVLFSYSSDDFNRALDEALQIF